LCIPPNDRAARTAEQDTAAGGREKRLIPIPDGRQPTASVRLRLFPKSRRLYAYMSFKTRGRNWQLYVGEATAENRAEALRRAWQLIEDKQLRTAAADRVARSSVDR
jgi:DNA mismatch endonuclease (patch repair protein)